MKLFYSLSSWIRYLRDFRKYKKLNERGNRFSIKWKDCQPCLDDNINVTSFDRHYVYHLSWAAKVLANNKPKKHIDISSSIYFSSIVSAFINIEFYDYRPPDLQLDNLHCDRADILSLPFEDNSIQSLSCMHVIEHIGLGRYGDPLDPNGDIKGILELIRVLSSGGNLLIAVPLGKPRIRFNAHRIYTHEQMINHFSGLSLEDFTLIPEDANDGGLLKNPTPDILNKQIYGCGCYWFKKT